MSFRPPSSRRVVVAVLGLLLFAGYVALGLSRITLDVDITRLLPPGLKETAGYRLFLKNFAGTEELIITLEGSDAGAVETVAAALDRSLRTGDAALARRVVWRSPFDLEATAGPTTEGDLAPATEGVGLNSPELIEFLAWGLLNQPTQALADLEMRLAPDRLEATLVASLEALTTSLDGMDRLMGYDPLGLTTPLLGDGEGARKLAPSLASPDGRFRLLYVESARPLANYKAMGEWLVAVRAAADAVARPRGVAVHFTGEPAFVSEISTSMERDMKLAGGIALLLICVVVWLGYRDLRLLPVLVGVVGVIFLLTLSTAGLLSGSLTVLTVGCGSILVGLTVDYGVLLYAAGGAAASAESLRRTRRGIQWAAATTAASFGALIFSGLPGLAELGVLVSVGVVIGAVLFLGVYPRVLRALRLSPDAGRGTPNDDADQESGSAWPDRVLPVFAGLVVAAGLSGLVVRGVPAMDLDSGSLRPRVSDAYDTLDRLTTHLGGGEQSLSVLVAGRDETEVAARLVDLESRLQVLERDGVISSFTLPRLLWPSPAVQQANLLGAASRLAREEERLRLGVLASGFAEQAFSLTRQVLAHWRQWAERPEASDRSQVIWPQDSAARWLLSRFAVSDSADGDPATRSMCLGIIRPRRDPPDDATMAALSSLQTEGVYLAGSKLIGRVMETHLSRGFFWLAVLFVVVTLGLLACALRRLDTFLLTFLSLALAFGALMGGMAWLGLGWNSFTLPALLLSLGTGSDYFIYVVLELQEHGSVARLRARLMRPLLVCVGASVCGFGSLAWAGNLGLSSLGRVCALALGLNLVVALFLLPWFWQCWRRVLRK